MSMFRGIYKGSLPPIDPSSIHSNESLADQLQDKDYYPVEWNNYFDQSRVLTIPGTENSFKIYESNVNVKDGYLFVFLHGGGYTSLSWSLVVDKIKKYKLDKNIRLLCYDCRGHGETKTNDDEDLSIGTLVNDCTSLINYYQDQLYSSGDDGKNKDGGENEGEEDEKDEKEKLKVIIIGHSLGGAVAIHSVSSGKINNLFGLIVVDVVEGTAMLALSSMRSILAKRPKSFDSVKDAIKWAISTDTVKNIESARVSVPSQIKLNNDDGKYHWIAHLEKTDKYWNDWFTGLSKEFLSSRVLKLLILAGTDRLDKELTIAQMQGKFQLVLLPRCGHVIQEDDPKSTSDALINFIKKLK